MVLRESCNETQGHPIFHDLFGPASRAFAEPKCAIVVH
jgi:hypothetical protein